MISDTNFQHRTAFASGAGVTHYFIVPYRCTLRSLSGIVQGDPGDDETMTLTGEATVGGTSVDLGVLTFGNTIAAGAIGTWVADASEGDSILEAGSFIKIVPSSGAAAVACDLDIELDIHALS